MSQHIREQLQATLGGAYTLERELGGGGMSRVFVAEEHRLKRKVVVKVLSPELAQGISVERFEREIQTAAALQQANIVTVLSAGETDGLPFYMMPFVEGESLRVRLGRGPLAITEVIGVLRDVSKALAYAHRQGVVHRDIKPDDVLLSEGTAVVTDFGIAKAISAARTESGGATLTQIGTSIGTPAYMAPEQAAGDPNVDQRADIYSLGAMGYELLAGQAVFAGRTPQRMLAAHMSEQPKPVSELRPDTPAPLAELVMSCLAKDPNDRPSSAGDIARILETITSGSGMQALPPVLLGGAGMFKKALVIYAAAFAVVALIAKAAIVAIGLPDWVFPGSLIVMALGLPAVLWTGYVQRVVRRSVIGTPTYTPGGTPSTTAHGTIATMALKAAPHVSWYRTARGGMMALGAFIAVIAAFMTMRALGIGPVGSLLASGAIKQDDKVLFTDFTVGAGDTTLGRVVSDAVRAGLRQARVFTVVAPSDIAATLQRMQRPVSAKIDLALARQVAQRDGIKAIVDGDVATVAGTYIITVRLVTSDSARELTSFRATAASADKLIDASDKVARQLLAKAGESLKRVQAAPPLAQVTTSSFEALRKYSEASRANDVENNPMRAVQLLREALKIDSTFAEGWRKLGAALGNAILPQSQQDSALARAYQLRERLGDSERDLITAYYFSTGPGRDRGKAVAAYEAMLARGDSTMVLVNLAGMYRWRREYARAESLSRADLRRRPDRLVALSGLADALLSQQKQAAFDSIVTVVRQRRPESPDFAFAYLNRLRQRGNLAELERALDSTRRAKSPLDPGIGFHMSAELARARGQLRQRMIYETEAVKLDSTVGRKAQSIAREIDSLGVRAYMDLPTADAVSALDAALARHPLEELPVVERPYLDVISVYARAGRPDRARAVLAQWRRAMPDTSTLGWFLPLMQLGQSRIAAAERRWSDAVADARRSDMLPDGPSTNCDECLPGTLMNIFAQAGMADSAIAQYEAYRRTPLGSRKREGPDLAFDAPMLERLARMYEMKGDLVHASELYNEFIERWKNADAELQPRVAIARQKLRRMSLDAPRGETRPK